MNVHARARASAQAIDRSATRLDPVVEPGRPAAPPAPPAAPAGRRRAWRLLVAAVAIWAGVALRGPTPIQPTLGPITRIRVGPSAGLGRGHAWRRLGAQLRRLHHLPDRPRNRPGAVLLHGVSSPWLQTVDLCPRRSPKDDCGWSTTLASTRPRSPLSTRRLVGR